MSEIIEEAKPKPKMGILMDRTHLLERELLYKKGIITKNGKEYYSSNTRGDNSMRYYDVVYIYVPWPRSLFNWFGRKWCGTINVDKRTIKIFRNYNECYDVLKKMPYFDGYDVEISGG